MEKEYSEPDSSPTFRKWSSQQGDKIFDIGCNQYIHSVDIQTTNQIINKDTGCIDTIYDNHTYLCSPDEYDKYAKELRKIDE